MRSDPLPLVPEPEPADLLFFQREGFRNLVRSMLKQTLKDILSVRKDPRASAELNISVHWPKTPHGRELIGYLLPGVSTQRFIAVLYADPARVLHEMERAEGDEPNEPRQVAFSGLNASAIPYQDGAAGLPTDEELEAASADEGREWMDQLSEGQRWG